MKIERSEIPNAIGTTNQRKRYKVYGIRHKAFLCFLIPLYLLPYTALAQGIGINTTGATPNASALLDIDGTTGGLLIPRMTIVQRNAIASPANSLMIYNTTNNCFQIKVIMNKISN